MAKVIWQKATLPPHMDGLTVFSRWRQCAPHLTRFLGHTQVPIQNDISVGSVAFAQLTAQHPYTLQWAAHYSLKITVSHGGSGLPPNTRLLEPTKSSTQTASLSVQTFLQFAGLTTVTVKPTDRPSYSICNNRLHVHSTVMRPNN